MSKIEKVKQKNIKNNSTRKHTGRLLLLISSFFIGFAALIVFLYIHQTLQYNVLGAQTTIKPPVVFSRSLTCADCIAYYHHAAAIILQKNSANPLSWGAACTSLENANSNQKGVYGYILCPIPAPTSIPTPTPTQVTGRFVVNIVNANNQFISPPAGNVIKIYSSNSPLTVKLLATISSNSQGWAGQVPAETDSVVAYPTQNYAITFSSCMGCTTPPSTTSQAGNPFLGGTAYFPLIVANKEVDVFVKFKAK